MRTRVLTCRPCYGDRADIQPAFGSFMGAVRGIPPQTHTSVEALDAEEALETLASRACSCARLTSRRA